jgi:RNA polymerase sigma-70 factor (family 1)
MSPAFVNGLKSLACEIAIHNSEDSFKKLFFSLFPSLYRFSKSMLKSKEQAEEIASDVMFKLWQHRLDLLHVDNIQVYALVIARNLSLNLIKKNSRAHMVSLGDIQGASPADPERVLIQHQNTNHVEAAVEALPTRCRLVFRLIREEGMSYREVAEILNISSKTVDSHLVTAMKKLTDALNLRHS